MPHALITGIAGQDGSYLAERLLAMDYDVTGLVRPDTDRDPNCLWRLGNVLSRIQILPMPESIEGWGDLFGRNDPDEFYHLAANSYVDKNIESSLSDFSESATCMSALFTAFLRYIPGCRFFFAGSSEMFGETPQSPQNENSSFCPRSIYGVNKVSIHHTGRFLRQQHGVFFSTGFLYNHESPRRDTRFVSRKITSQAVQIKLGAIKKMVLGDLDAKRDWGFAKDYVRAMHLALNADRPEDFVVATGVLHSVREILEIVFSELGLNYKDHVESDPQFLRKETRVPLVGDATKARRMLGWTSEVSFEDMILMMLKSDWDKAN